MAVNPTVRRNLLQPLPASADHTGRCCKAGPWLDHGHAWSDFTKEPEDAELADVIDRLGNPEVLKQLSAAATGATAEWLTERKNRRALRVCLERNADAKHVVSKIQGM